MASEPVIGFRGVSAILAPTRLEVEELATAGLVASSPAVLRELGFTRAHIAEPGGDPGRFALDAARRALADASLDPLDVDLLIWASARPESHVRPAIKATARADVDRDLDVDVFNGFRYQSGWLQDELGLDNAEVLAVAQQGCSTMFSALRAGRAILAAEEGCRHVLCVAVDVLPAGAQREILYNVISDGACAVVMSRGCAIDRWIGFRQISRGYYWDPVDRGPEIMASYFLMAKQVVHELLDAQGLEPRDVDIVLPTGINRTSWDVLLRLVNIPSDRLYAGPEPFGHTISADSFVQLEHLRRHHPGSGDHKVLMFTYGFGSSWCALLLEH
jgi:3-oxoacyl-[acyl-carrier-protein] synthase-3